MRWRLFFVCWLLAGSVMAIDPEPAFDDPEVDAQYRELINEVRCLVCQNQTIADSSAALAADLRREIRRMFEEGATRAEVEDFLLARYGDFVLYRPPLRPGDIYTLGSAPDPPGFWRLGVRAHTPHAHEPAHR